MKTLLVIAAVILSGCAPMTPEQAARSDAALQNMIYQKQMGYQRQQEIRLEQGRQQQQNYHDARRNWPDPVRTTCTRNYLNPSQLDCVSR